LYSPNSRTAANGLSDDQCPNRKTFSLDLNVSDDMYDIASRSTDCSTQRDHVQRSCLMCNQKFKASVAFINQYNSSFQQII